MRFAAQVAGAGLAVAALAALPGCEARTAEAEPAEAPAAEAASAKPLLGLMTSLPLYWPLGASFGEFASGEAQVPPQRQTLEAGFELMPLDTLSPIAGLSAGDLDTDPLAGLDRLAVIQPRGLSPADNVALDDWVKAGGKLLLVLDPMLTGEYELPLGDPRRPVDMALIPPVVGRWGLGVGYDENQSAELRSVAIGEGQLVVNLAGNVILQDDGAGECEVLAEAVAARCRIDEGEVMLLVDAFVFEQGQAAPLSDFMDFAFP